MKRRLLVLLITLPIASVACTATSGVSGLNVRDQAAAEATAIIQQAEATAMVVQARAMATAMIEKAGAVPATPVPAKAEPASAPAIGSTPAAAQGVAAAVEAQASSQAVGDPTPTRMSAQPVELLGVSFAADSGLIIVRFRAPPKIAEKWWQGRVSVIDEASGTAYNEIPVMPKIGPLIGRPRVAGQIGYVMLVNGSPGLHPGSIVTVILGDFKQEHVTVQ